MEHLKIVEKILNESIMQEKFIKYKNYPEIRKRNLEETVRIIRKIFWNLGNSKMCLTPMPKKNQN